MNWSKFSLVVILCLGLVLGLNFLILSVTDPISPVRVLAACQDEINLEALVELTTFPIDLDVLFWADNLTVRNERLNEIGNGSTEWMLSPWGVHFVGGHGEGLDHLYTSPSRVVEVRAPADGSLDRIEVLNGTEFQFNGNELISEVAVYYNLDAFCRVQLRDLDLLKTIYDEIQQTGTYTFTTNELIGYTHVRSVEGEPGIPLGVEIFYYYKLCPICPYLALSSELKTQYASYFALQYERARFAGVFPEPNICNEIDIGIENTVWGVWSYQTGPYDDVLGSEESWGTDLEYFTFFNRDLADPETFYRIPEGFSVPYVERNLTSDVVGLYRDNQIDASETGFNNSGFGLVKLYEGSVTDGILEIVPQLGNEWWEDSNDSIYVRFLVDQGNAGLADDILTMEYFASPSEAQAGFTDQQITCIRSIPQFQQFDLQGILEILPVILLGLGVVVIIRKRKK
ncbi:MAG: hypothetical protein ACFFC7_16725 [Candidatus Hermodarchaeota archaeon]